MKAAGDLDNGHIKKHPETKTKGGVHLQWEDEQNNDKDELENFDIGTSLEFVPDLIREGREEALVNNIWQKLGTLLYAFKQYPSILCFVLSTSK